MTDDLWRRVDDDVAVTFLCGCTGKGSARGRTWDLLCANAGYEHGHAMIDSDDGLCRLPFPVASQEGLRTLLSLCNDWITPAERDAFLSLEQVKALPEKMSEAEAAILRDPLRYAHYARYAFVGFGR
ncbi:MAG TPA: hypothetical protein VL426_03135 [Candidatus Binatia bacterium]|jgi:hypothetical protein|nr:hypothetical protein [Candidatus Binatia bacterium]